MSCAQTSYFCGSHVDDNSTDASTDEIIAFMGRYEGVGKGPGARSRNTVLDSDLSMMRRGCLRNLLFQGAGDGLGY